MAPAPSIENACQTYSAKETARILGIGLQTVYDAINREEIPNVGLGGVKRVPKQWVIARIERACRA